MPTTELTKTNGMGINSLSRLDTMPRSTSVCTGGIEPGESAETCARRELREELGVEASRLERLMSVDPFTAIMVSPTELFVATELSRIPARPEGSERIAEVRLSLVEAVQMVRTGQITHAPTCIGVLWLASRQDF